MIRFKQICPDRNILRIQMFDTYLENVTAYPMAYLFLIKIFHGPNILNREHAHVKYTLLVGIIT